jgi:hypothetical protein
LEFVLKYFNKGKKEGEMKQIPKILIIVALGIKLLIVEILHINLLTSAKR